MDVYSDQELNQILLNITNDVIAEVAGNIRYEVEKAIDDIVYFSGRNKVYAYGKNTPMAQFSRAAQPTFEFRKSWTNRTESKGNNVIGYVEQQFDKMRVDADNFVHGSNYWTGGNDVREYLAAIINEGKAGSFFGNGFWRHPRRFWDEAMKVFADGTVDKWIREGFEKRGIILEGMA